MKFLLDTDHISFLQRRAGAEYVALANRMSRHPPSDFAFSIISFHEQVLGAHTYIGRARTSVEASRGYLLLQEILLAFQAAPILPFDATAATIFDGLRSQRLRLATMDLRIAAIALSHNLTLLTRNASDFAQVPRLVIEDWTM